MSFSRVSFLVRLLAVTLLLALTGTSWSQEMTPTQATAEAFDALLSLPQGLPERSEFPAGPSDRIKDQAALQAALEDDLSAGADLDAYRYGGTLLLHALRANLQDTALWLLANGANPRLEVDGDHFKGNGDDALQLAILYRRWRVVDALLRRPAVAPHTPRDLAFRWVGLFDARAPSGTEDAAARELARRLAWPDGWYGGCLLAAAQDKLLLPMLLKTSARTAVRLPPGQVKALHARDARIAAQCQAAETRFRANHVAGRFATFTPTALAQADARLATPLLQLLAPHLDTPADVHTWAALSLRRPWQDTAFARGVVQAFLFANVPPEMREDELRTVPPLALHAALDDDVTLHAWFARLGAMPAPQAAAALAQVDDAMLRRHADAAVRGLAGIPLGPGAAPDVGHPHPSRALWSALLGRLPTPLRLGPSVEASTYMSSASWPELFARGYHPTAAELLTHLQFATAAGWPDQWPQLRAAATPEAITEAMRLFAARWEKPCAAGYQAPQLANAQALALMAASGARLPPPVTLSPRCVHLAQPEALHALLAINLVTLPPGETVPAPPPVPEDPAGVVPHGKFVLAPRECALAPPEAVVRAVIHGEFLVDGPETPQERSHAPRPALLQAIDEPGASACAWLVTGGVGSYREITDETSFFEGHYFVNPCVEPTLTAEVWRVVDGRVVASPAFLRNEEGALQLKDSDGARRFLLTLPVRSAGCDGGRHAELYTWTSDAASHQLMSINGENDPARRTYDQQCKDVEAATCFGLDSDDALTPWLPQGVADFVAANGGEMRRRWIAAFLANDAAALKAADVFPSWRAEALAALNASPLPLAEKRQRIAWMFRDKAGLAESFGSNTDYDAAEGVTTALVGMVAWLPREDWRPLLAALGRDNLQLQPLLEAAQAKGDANLACTFAQAADKACEAAANR